MHPKATKTRNRQVVSVQESKDDRLYGPNYARDASIRGSNWAAVEFQVWVLASVVLALRRLCHQVCFRRLNIYSLRPKYHHID